MSAHSLFNYNRRSSVASPYTIPAKHQTYYSSYNHTPHESQHHRSYSHGHQRPVFRSEDYSGEYKLKHEMAVDDGSSEIMSSSVPTLSREFVARRISEGETGRLKQELKCEACGKGYKHISSLAKHLWEHTPEWNVTKKLLISKHQQVQLLEAASILVGMNEPSTRSRSNSVFEDDTPPPTAKGRKNSMGRKNSISQDPPSLVSRNEPGVSFVAGYYLDVNHRSRSNSVDQDIFNSPANPNLISPQRHDGEVNDGILGNME